MPISVSSVAGANPRSGRLLQNLPPPAWAKARDAWPFLPPSNTDHPGTSSTTIAIVSQTRPPPRSILPRSKLPRGSFPLSLPLISLCLPRWLSKICLFWSKKITRGGDAHIHHVPAQTSKRISLCSRVRICGAQLTTYSLAFVAWNFHHYIIM
jgi:hypothetical protein